MSPEVVAVMEPFVQRGLFPSAEAAIAEIVRDYTLRQIERYRAIESEMEARYGMTYEQFEAYLQARSRTLRERPSVALGQAVMAEEDDAEEWKIAREMAQSWLGLQREVTE